MTDQIGDFSRLAADCRVGLVLDSATLQLDKFPASEITRVLDFIHERRQQRRQMAARCRKTARQHLHWDAATTALMKGYRALAQGEVA